MKKIYSALIATVLFGSAGVALADNVPRASDEVPSGPSENLSTQTGSANTQAGDTAVKGGTAKNPEDPSLGNDDNANAQGGSGSGYGNEVRIEEPRADDEIPSGPSDDLSTQTGSANTQAGDTAVKGGTAVNPEDPSLGNDDNANAQDGTGSGYGNEVRIEEPRADNEIPSGPSDDLSTQTGSANTQAGDTATQEGVTNQ